MDEKGRLKQIIEAVGTDTASTPPDFYKTVESMSKEKASLINRENSEILEMRQLWSKWILRLIIVIAVFDIILVTLYGFGIWNFNDPTVVIAVITENFLKILGLGFLITSNIFRKIFR